MSKGSPFIKAFLPGLVLGIIVGGLAGAMLPPLIESGTLFGGGSSTIPDFKPNKPQPSPTPEQVEQAAKDQARDQVGSSPEMPAVPVMPAETKPTDTLPTQTAPAATEPMKHMPPS